jgi:hypothetical protein
MSPNAKAIGNFIINLLAAAAGGLMAVVNAGEVGSAPFQRPMVWIGLVVAILPVVRATWNESPARPGGGE